MHRRILYRSIAPARPGFIKLAALLFMAALLLAPLAKPARIHARALASIAGAPSTQELINPLNSFIMLPVIMNP